MEKVDYFLIGCFFLRIKNVKVDEKPHYKDNHIR